VILIVTSQSDYTADWLVLELERRGTQFARFNTDSYPSSTHLVWHEDGASSLAFTGTVVDLSEVTAVWYRRPVPPVLPPGLSAGRSAWAAAEAREALDGVWKTLTANWVNHPDRNRLADCKPEQLRRARALGFDVPASLVTNHPDAAVQFARAHEHGVICKPLFSGRIDIEGRSQLFFTSLLDADALKALNHAGPEPYLFQALIDKRYDVRVTVIGNQAFPVRIESQNVDPDAEIDWRRGDTETLAHHTERLPNDLADLCVALTHSYGLRFAAIDLARTESGYVFFEINPNGQWAWIEQRTGLPLRARLVDLLIEG
jgi:hypothetical protein